MLDYPNLIMIGSGGRNTGKTDLACGIINRFKGNNKIIGLKITAITNTDGLCPRGGKGCGVCSSLEGDYLITEEKNKTSKKDTGRLLNSGADNVFWLRARKEKLIDGFIDFDKHIKSMFPDNYIVICESNSLRKIITPGIFIIIHNTKTFKKSAAEVKNLADVIIKSGFDINKIINNIKITNNSCYYNSNMEKK